MTYRIGVIGLGQRIAHVLAAMKDAGFPFELAGYSDPAPVGLPILDAHDIPRGPDRGVLNDLLAAGPYDLLMIGSPNHLHYEHLLAAMETRRPIFTEKPIVRTEEETLALARHLRDKSVPPIFVGLVMRSMPIVREVIS
ncbi:MAG TPA: Gfo/Idh/MocA family oxidoreductase, partial [Rhizomicrobium sp.]|nr:Gfo/Idh/MocA family oxidoreductase [Rhizomicrobium sp.]